MVPSTRMQWSRPVRSSRAPTAASRSHPERQDGQDADDRRRAEDLAPLDQPEGPVERDPLDPVRLIDVGGLPDIRGFPRQEQLVLGVGSADHGLERHQWLQLRQAPARLLFNLARRRRGDVLVDIDLAPGELPNPTVDDETMPM